MNRNRAYKLTLDFAFHGIENKAEKLAEVIKSLGIDYKNVAYVGDDINDLEVLRKVGFAFIPRNAQTEVRALNNVRLLNSAGGEGVIREIYNMIRS